MGPGGTRARLRTQSFGPRVPGSTSTPPHTRAPGGAGSPTAQPPNTSLSPSLLSRPSKDSGHRRSASRTGLSRRTRRGSRSLGRGLREAWRQGRRPAAPGPRGPLFRSRPRLAEVSPLRLFRKRFGRTFNGGEGLGSQGRPCNSSSCLST